jgi:polysaccharide biosynthesis/export protein
MHTMHVYQACHRLMCSLCLKTLCSTIMVVLVGLLASAGSAAQVVAQASEPAATSGPVRLRQPAVSAPALDAGTVNYTRPVAAAAAPAAPGEFELFVRSQTGSGSIGRLGRELFAVLAEQADANDYNPLVPPDYVVRAGDELVVTLWGSIDADLRLTVDRNGRVFIPRIGPVLVSGVRYADLTDVIGKRAAQVFRNYQLSVSLGQLRAIRVYVTGFVPRPGPIVVSGLSTIAQVLLKAGGPAAAGSFRNIELRRGQSRLATYDLYDLLLKGERGMDLRLEADDVVHVGPVGTQVAVLGSVNRAAIVELKAGEGLDDVLKMAGGFSAVGDTRRVSLERFQDRGNERVRELSMPATGTILANGDLIRAFNLSDVVQPVGNQNKRVRIEGEVQRPGEYLLPPASSIADAIRAAGGLTANVYLNAAELTRESVRVTQQQNYERALRDLETQLAANATQRSGTAEELAAANAASTANARLLERLRMLKPSGRIVLQTRAATTELPEIAVEDGDRLLVPKRPNTVGVFGSVFSAGSYLYAESRTVGDYLRLAGGPTKGADQGSIFVIRANGTVSSSLQESNFFSRGNQIADLIADPGDTVFVPEETNKATWIQSAKDWTQILYQFGIGLAGIRGALN